MGQRDDKRRARRAQILDEARAMFERDGFEGMTFRALAQRCDMALGTVFNYFPDKEALLYEALHDDLERVLREACAGLPDERRVHDQLMAIAMTFCRYYAARPALSRCLLGRALFAQADWGERFRGQVARVGLVVAMVLRQGQARGEIDEQADIEACTLSFFATYYFALLRGLACDEVDLEAQAALIERLLHQAIGAIEAPPTQG